MLPKRLLAITLGAALAAMGGRDVRAQWMQTNGPYGGEVFSLGTSAPHLFAGANTGLFLSSNNGENWIADTNGLPKAGVTAILAEDSTLFLGVAGTGIVRSTDGGQSWMVLDSGLTDSTVLALQRYGTYVYAGTEQGIFRLKSGAFQWESLQDQLPPLPVTSILPMDSAVLIGMQGVHISTDSGLSWQGDGLVNDGITCLARMGHTVFAVTAQSGLFRSNALGSWSPVDSGLPPHPDIGALIVIGDTVFAGTSTGALYRSSDTGTTWQLESVFSWSAINALFVAGKYLYAGTATNGVFRSGDDGRSWTETGGGLGFVNTTSVNVDGSVLLAGSTSGAFRSTDGGATWAPSGSGLTYSFVENFASAGPMVFAASYGGGMFRSSDGGMDWVPTDSGISNLEVKTVVLRGTTLYAGSTQELFRSMDSGTSWVVDTAGTGVSPDIWCFDTVGSNLFAGAAWGVFRSVRTDTAWTFSKVGQNATVASLASIDSELFASTYGQGVFISTDFGQTWDTTALSGAANCLLPVSGNIFAATISQGIFLSMDRGLTWLDVSDGLTNKQIRSLTVLGPDLYAASWGSGIWRRPLSDFGISSVSEPQPNGVTIRNYPNPFSQSTTISFNSENAGYADVSIVNPLGTEVARLFSGELAPGEHQFLWSDPAAPDGMYECVIRMNGRVEEVGMVRMR